MLKWVLTAIIAILVGILVMTLRKPQNSEGALRYVITETDGPNSLDPLLADMTENLPVARMIYATPLEVNSKGNLSSKVLESFTYDPHSTTMTWKVRAGIRFSDGAEITPSDVAFAVARMAYTRPKFPAIENIVGVDTWSKKKDALQSLPEGISINQNQILIRFKKAEEHPLFRFCLEIFSIIPKRCVDLTTNKITCDPIPTSGYYSMSNQTKDAIDFQIVGDGKIHDAPAPPHIRFEYMLPRAAVDIAPHLDSRTVISGNELRFTPETMAEIQKKTATAFAPAARIAILLTNPSGVFKDKTCRRAFADAYREAFGTYSKGQMQKEASLFTDILPGYTKTEALAARSPVSSEEKNRCLELFRKNGIPWAKAKQESSSTFFDDGAELAFQALGLPSTPTFELDTRSQVRDAFTEGKTSFLAASTGFWALDPAGDIQMLLTPNMHKMLQFVAADGHVQSLIRDLKKSEDKPLAFKSLNQYIYDEGLFNVFAHVRRFYSAGDYSLIAELPMSITSPAPWQVFKVRK